MKEEIMVSVGNAIEILHKYGFKTQATLIKTILDSIIK